MAIIPQKHLRNHVGDVLRRAESGESLVITVSGRPVAQLGPLRRGEWVDSSAVSDIWASPGDAALERDLARFGALLRDPFA